MQKLTFLLGLLGLLLFASCNEKANPSTEVQEEQGLLEETEEAGEEVGEEIGEAAEEVADETEEVAEEVDDELEEGAEEVEELVSDEDDDGK